MRRLVRRVLVLTASAVPVAGLLHCERIRVDADGGTVGNADTDGVCAPQQVEEDAGDDAGPGCSHWVQFACGLPEGVKPRDNCFFTVNDCYSLCGGYYLTCQAYGANCAADGTVVPNVDDAGLVVECQSCVGIAGRRPDGLRVLASAPNVTSVGAYFAQMAHLEAASVHAFRIMGRELALLGAPSEILVAVERARKDEIAHTKITATLARAHGAMPEKARVARAKRRSLEAVALENAVEGCVRETFAALLATHHGAHAADLDVRAAMNRIAVDETRHAALSWRVAEWLEAKLDPAARARVDAARLGAVADLASEIGNAVDPVVARAVGLPSATTQRRLLATLASSLGLAAAA